MAEVANKEVFDTINTSVTDALRAKFGPPGHPDSPEKLPAQTAVALLQLSFVYFAATGAPKQVIRDFVEQLLEVDPEPSTTMIKRDSNRLHLVGPDGRPVRR